MIEPNISQSIERKGFRLFLSIAVRRSSLIVGFKVALVVGIAVNLINQGDHLIARHFALISIPKVIITFCIPFCVSIYNLTVTRLRYDPGVRAIADASLICQTCGHAHEIEEGELVPDCEHCMVKGRPTHWSQKAPPVSP